MACIGPIALVMLPATEIPRLAFQDDVMSQAREKNEREQTACSLPKLEHMRIYVFYF